MFGACYSAVCAGDTNTLEAESRTPITAAYEETLIHSKVINPSVVHSAFHAHFTNFMACHPSLDFLSLLLI